MYIIENVIIVYNINYTNNIKLLYTHSHNVFHTLRNAFNQLFIRQILTMPEIYYSAII